MVVVVVVVYCGGGGMIRRGPYRILMSPPLAVRSRLSGQLGALLIAFEFRSTRITECYRRLPESAFGL